VALATIEDLWQTDRQMNDGRNSWTLPSDNFNLNLRMKMMKGSIAKLHSTVVDLLLQSMEGSSDKLDAPVVDLRLWSMDPWCAPPGPFEMCAPPGPFEMPSSSCSK
jgi:hypothetical protein